MELDLIKRIIGEVLGVDEAEITPDTNFTEDLSADSMDLFQIIVGIEEALDIEMDSEKYESIKTVADAAELIKSTIGK